MPVETPPPPPAGIEQPARNATAPIADVRDQFARKTKQKPEDEARARAFIESKLEMIRSDPNMTDAQKAAAIEEIRARR